MPTTHTGGGYTVTINDDGSINVKRGDTISKYSMAIHGDFNHLHEYRRKEGGALKPLANINLIVEGETLYHAPSVAGPGGGDGSGGAPADDLPKKPNGEYDIDRILEENNIPLAYRDKLVWLINSGRGLQATITFVGIFAAEGVIGGGLALTNAIAGPVLGTMAAVYALWKARNFGIQQAGLRGTIYGTVAWAFGEQPPKLPKNMEKLIRDGNASGDLENYRSVFENAAKASFGHMRSYAAQQGFDEADLKVAIQAFGKGRPEILAAAMMVDIADYYYSGNDFKRRSFLQPWSWYPDDKYVGRPSYPPEISQRYGW